MGTMRVRIGVFLVFLGVLCGNEVLSADEEEDAEEKFKLIVVSDGSTTQLQYVDYLNTSAQRISPNLEVHHLIVADPTTEGDRNVLCDEMLNNADFMLSIATSDDIQKMVKAVALLSRFPTIQVDYKPWTLDRPDLSVNMTNQNQTQAVVEPAEATPPVNPNPNYVTIIPASTVFMNVMVELPKYINFTKTATVLYDDSFSEEDKTWKEMLNRVSGVTFSLISMKTNDTEIREQIDSLKAKPSVQEIWLFGKTPNVERYINVAKPEMETTPLRFGIWRVLTKDTRSFQCEPCTTVKAFWIRMDGDTAFQKMRDYKNYLRDTLDLTELVTGDTEIEASYFYDMVDIAWSYIMTLNSTVDYYPTYGCYNQTFGANKTYTLTEYMADTPEGSYGPYIPDNNKGGNYYQNALVKFTLHDFEKDARVSKAMGNWTITDSVSVFYEQLIQDIKDIKHYRVTIVVQPPFIEECPGTDECPHYPYRGYCIDLIEKIKEIVGFTYELYPVKDHTYGSINEQGEWNGLIGELISGDADIALAPLSVMAERENFVDFTVPYYDLVGTTILMKKQEVNYSLFKFMTVLEPPVWGCIVGAYFFTSFLLWIFDKFSPYSYTNNKEKYKDDPEKREFTFKECLWFCMTSLTPQGGGEAPKNISGRLVAATWWLFGFIIIASYTANLAAFLTVSRLETPISSLDDLAKQYKIKYAPVRGTASETYFKRMAEIEERFYDIWKAMSLNESMTPQERAQLAVWDYPVSDKFTNMWRYMQEAQLPNSTAEAITRVLASPSATEGFAYIGDATEIRYAELTDCNLQMVGNEFSRKPYAIAVQQGSPLKDQISSAILKLLNQRELEHLKENWWNRNPNKKDCPKVEDESDGISIQNIGGVFIVILVGIALSIVTLAFEYWYYKDRPRKDDPNSHMSNNQVMAFSVQNGSNGNNNELKEINANGALHSNRGLSGQFNTAYDARPE